MLKKFPMIQNHFSFLIISRIFLFNCLPSVLKSYFKIFVTALSSVDNDLDFDNLDTIIMLDHVLVEDLESAPVDLAL